MAEDSSSNGKKIRFYFPSLVTFNPEEVYLEVEEYSKIAEIIGEKLHLPSPSVDDPWIVFPMSNCILSSGQKIFCDFEHFKVRRCEMGY